jgi:Concanavalin A-like lectin/glucanases superfamily
MPEPTDYLRRYDFSDGAGSTVTSQAGGDNLAIQGTSGAWVTTTMPGLDAVGYRFARAGDGRAQTLITGADLFSGQEYTIAIRCKLDADDRDPSFLVSPSVGVSAVDLTGHMQPWSDGRFWAGHVVGGNWREVAVALSKIKATENQPHWWVVTGTVVSAGIRVRLYLDGVEVAAATKTADAATNLVDRLCVANLYNGGVLRGCDATVYGLRIYDRALPKAEVAEMGIAPGGINTAPVAEAGPNQTVEAGTFVDLDASASLDAETAAENLTYQWTITNPAGTGLTDADIVNADQAVATVLMPQVAAQAQPVFQVRITDEGGMFATDTVTVTINPAAPPEDQFPNVELGTFVELLLGNTWVDITAYVVSSVQGVKVEITRGRRDWAEDVEAAECKLMLLNPDGRFSSRNPASPYFGLLGRNVQMRVTVVRSNVYRRFWGEVSSWPQQWEPTHTLVTVPISAYGILRRLSLGTEPIQSVLRRNIPTIMENLVGYWPLEDAASPNRRRMSSGLEGGEQMKTVSSARPEYANYDGFDASAPILTVNDADIRGEVGFYTYISGQANLQFGFLMHIPDGGSTGNQTIGEVHTSGSAEQWEVRYQTTNNGTIQLRARNSNDVEILNSGDLQSNLNGRDLWVLVQLKRTQNHTAIDWTVYVFDAGGDPNGEDRSGTLATTAGLGRAEYAVINAGGGITDIAVGHFTVQSQITSPTAMVEALAAYDGEPAGRRIQRLCEENNIPFAWIGDLDDTEPMGPQRVSTLLDLIREATRTDLGMLYELTDQFGLGYRTRTSLYNQTPQVAFTYGQGQLSALAPVEDDQTIRNDITVTNAGGASARQVLEEGALSVQAPPNGIGRYSEQFEINADEGRLSNHAALRLALRTIDEARYPEIGVELSNPRIVVDPAQTHAIMSARPGDRITVDNMPPWMPPDQVSQLILGHTEQIYLYRHHVAWNCTPESPFQIGSYSTGGIAPGERGVGAAASGTDAITPGLPAGTVAGDVLLLFIETAGGDVVPAMAGWVDAPASPVIMGADTRLTVRWHVHAAGETAPTVPDSGDHQVGRIVGFYDVDPDDPFDVTAAGTEASDTSVSFPAVTTTRPQTRLVNAIATGTDVASTAQMSAAANVNTTVTHVRERVDNWTSAGNGGGIGVITAAKNGAGATGSTTATLTTAATKAMLTLALQPPPPAVDAKRYDTAGSQLVTAVGAAATELTVVTTTPPLWTEDLEEMPFPIRVAGEDMLVTAVRPLAQDTFTRTQANDWQSTDSGHAWTEVGGAAATADFDTNGSRGDITLSAPVTAERFAVLAPVVGDAEILTQIRVSAVATGGSLIAGLVFRYAGVSAHYKARVHFTTGSNVFVSVTRDATQIGTNQGTGFTYAAGDTFWLRAQLKGHRIIIKVWPTSGPEPPATHISREITETEGLLDTGQLGVTAFALAGNTNVNPVLSFDSLQVLNPQLFIVTRATNGVAKAQAAGVAVSLAPSARTTYAL